MDTTSPLEAEALSLQEFVAILQLEDPNELANGTYTYTPFYGTFYPSPTRRYTSSFLRKGMVSISRN